MQPAVSPRSEAMAKRRNTKTPRVYDVQRMLGVRIQELRKVAGLNQEDLAEAAGVQMPTLSQYETGKTAPSLTTLVHLADALGQPLEEFFRFDELPRHDTDHRRAQRKLVQTVHDLDADTVRLLTKFARLMGKHGGSGG